MGYTCDFCSKDAKEHKLVCEGCHAVLKRLLKIYDEASKDSAKDTEEVVIPRRQRGRPKKKKKEEIKTKSEEKSKEAFNLIHFKGYIMRFCTRH